MSNFVQTCLRAMRRTMMGPAVAAAAALLVSSPALALTLTGNAEVTDSDVIQLNGYHVYLVGVESLDSDQVCGVNNQDWECYPAAVRALQTIVEAGEVSCDVLSGPNFLDQLTARCSIGGRDVGEAYVRTGFGLAVPSETHDYDAAQQAAQDARSGLWQSTFYPPQVWRQAHGKSAGRPSFRPPAAGQ